MHENEWVEAETWRRFNWLRFHGTGYADIDAIRHEVEQEWAKLQAEADAETEEQRRELQEGRIRDMQERWLEQQLAAGEDEGLRTSPGPEPEPYSRGQLETAFKFHARGKSIRWLAEHDVISRYRMEAAKAKGVSWDLAGDRLVLPPGTFADSDGLLHLPR